MDRETIETAVLEGDDCTNPFCAAWRFAEAFDAIAPDPDYFAMGVRTMTEQQAAAETAHTADQDLYHDRAEWRAQ